MAETKFRPYFTISEINEIIEALKTSPTPTRLGIIRYLTGFKLKCESGILTSAYSSNPRDSISQRLGFDPTNAETAQKDKKVLQEAAYQKQLINPKACTPHEIQMAMTHRYENNLMSEREEREYETNILGVKS